MSDEARKNILVVDDEAAIRKLVGAMVTQLGYTVLTANGGGDALNVYNRLKAPIELLITDVVTPGMSGPMLAEKLTLLQPDLKVLYISGYDHTNVVQKYVVEKGHALLAKPFTMEELQAKVMQMLAAPSNSAA